jgi:hypothetical protein
MDVPIFLAKDVCLSLLHTVQHRHVFDLFSGCVADVDDLYDLSMCASMYLKENGMRFNDVYYCILMFFHGCVVNLLFMLLFLVGRKAPKPFERCESESSCVFSGC